MTEEFRKGHAAGYANGIRDTQPDWIKADERRPDEDGMYWAIVECTKDCIDRRKGDLYIEAMEPWDHGEWLWLADGERIIYWAEQPIITPPRVLMGRQFRKKHYLFTDGAAADYPEAG